MEFNAESTLKELASNVVFNKRIDKRIKGMPKMKEILTGEELEQLLPDFPGKKRPRRTQDIIMRFSASPDYYQKSMQGFYWNPEDSEIVTTNGNTLAITTKIQLQDFPKGVYLPADVKKYNTNESLEEFIAHKSYIRFRKLFYYAPDKPFPDYHVVIPACPYEMKGTLLMEKLPYLRVLAHFSGDFSRYAVQSFERVNGATVQLTLKDDKTGKEVKFLFNTERLLLCLQALWDLGKPDETVVRFTGSPDSPVILENPDLKLVIMPYHLRSETAETVLKMTPILNNMNRTGTYEKKEIVPGFFMDCLVKEEEAHNA